MAFRKYLAVLMTEFLGNYANAFTEQTARLARSHCSLHKAGIKHSAAAATAVTAAKPAMVVCDDSSAV